MWKIVTNYYHLSVNLLSRCNYFCTLPDTECEFFLFSISRCFLFERERREFLWFILRFTGRLKNFSREVRQWRRIFFCKVVIHNFSFLTRMPLCASKKKQRKRVSLWVNERTKRSFRTTNWWIERECER